MEVRDGLRITENTLMRMEIRAMRRRMVILKAGDHLMAMLQMLWVSEVSIN